MKSRSARRHITFTGQHTANPALKLVSPGRLRSVRGKKRTRISASISGILPDSSLDLNKKLGYALAPARILTDTVRTREELERHLHAALAGCSNASWAGRFQWRQRTTRRIGIWSAPQSGAGSPGGRAAQARDVRSLDQRADSGRAIDFIDTLLQGLRHRVTSTLFF